ncbi:MAG: L,D-transpeptidase [Pseudomonadota bacterium]
MADADVPHKEKETIRLSRRSLLMWTASAYAGGVIGAFLPDLAFGATPKTMIKDEFGNWVPYTKRRAYRYYKENGKTLPEFQRQVVDFKSSQAPGTIIVNANRHFLFLVLSGKKAMRYGIGVGRDGYGWSGIVQIGRKAKWPRWTPPADMVRRDPEAAKWANGMPGGPANPLGSRALYLYNNGRDTIYRIHGTNKPWTIGLNASSGCIRMNNDDIVDLYDRVQKGSPVIVLMQGTSHRVGV